MRITLGQSKQQRDTQQQDKTSIKGRGFLTTLKKCLAKTNEILTTRIDDLILGKKDIDHNLIEELEEILISSDLGVRASHKLIEQVQAKLKRGEAEKPEVVKNYLKEGVYNLLLPRERSLPLPDGTPYVIMVIGVNGTGKTTTIAKLAHYFKSQGKKVLLVAADTFRAAAIEQLEVWSKRIECAFIKQGSGSDPSAVVYDALKSSSKKGSDIVIIDTAGRMHTKTNLMEELKKITRVIGREHPGAPHEVLLVIDATTGQNALSQATLFQQAIEVTGIVLTKLDGTSKGGIIVAISEELAIPIRFIGSGEDLDDLSLFSAEEFVNALFTTG